MPKSNLRAMLGSRLVDGKRDKRAINLFYDVIKSAAALTGAAARTRGAIRREI